ncbi:hypothetical protein [Escherichia coli]|uniref:hypothetical protein n=1 Tax=Escherichia coli TaxID=562 RepID=UPI0007E8C229|nr:hypothetical protein [Escherichia coli]EEU2030150.1 hypothetical protein [Escherichia coli]EEW5075285.1 hypothetical protein [Escherichia coli]EEY2487335.1 hypothetical protein [Escherichia coli]EFF3876490.1 hypothetical protein [Escherichia coli]EFF3887122.1 hypothetical protein [Escherichia coli]
MTNDELQKIALSIIERQREKALQERRLRLNPPPLTSQTQFALEAFVEKYPRRLKSAKTRPPG